MRKTHVSAALGALALAGLAWPAAAAGGLESGIIAEMNYARTRPAEYAQVLRRDPGLRDEDPGAVAEALRFLASQKPLPPLEPHAALAAAARTHATAQGRTREIGHRSPGGATLGQRLQAQGVWAGMAAENISYGYDEPRAVVRQLIVDSGIPDRGHRTNIFGRYEAAGVSCGGHGEYRSMCVINFAGALQPR